MKINKNDKLLQYIQERRVITKEEAKKAIDREDYLTVKKYLEAQERGHGRWSFNFHVESFEENQENLMLLDRFRLYGAVLSLTFYKGMVKLACCRNDKESAVIEDLSGCSTSQIIYRIHQLLGLDYEELKKRGYAD